MLVAPGPATGGAGGAPIEPTEPTGDTGPVETKGAVFIAVTIGATDGIPVNKHRLGNVISHEYK